MQRPASATRPGTAPAFNSKEPHFSRTFQNQDELLALVVEHVLRPRGAEYLARGLWDMKSLIRGAGAMPDSTAVTKFAWNDIPKERVTNLIDRRIVCGERAMVAHVYLQQGAIVPKHSHDNEQLSYILKGKLRFWVGDNLSESFDVGPGEILHLPSNVPHKAEALEETLDVDIFCPPRQDWLNHTDTYFKDQ